MFPRADKMQAMVFDLRHGLPLKPTDVPAPMPGTGEVLIQVHACAVWRTDLHVVDGELPSPKVPIIPGHQIVGTVIETGRESHAFKVGDRVGVPWLGWTRGECGYCASGRENLCDRARFTGYQIDGGYAEMAEADERFCFALPPSYSDVAAAPLLRAGLIGYRALRMAGDANTALDDLGHGRFEGAAVLVTPHSTRPKTDPTGWSKDTIFPYRPTRARHAHYHPPLSPSRGRHPDGAGAQGPWHRRERYQPDRQP
jgi:propanol-preferring alcohol dehydrogenase